MTDVVTESVVRRRRFTVDEYHRMAETGILHEDDRLELIEAEIIEMSPIGHDHAGSVIVLLAWFTEHLRGRFVVSIQNPVRLSGHIEPQPDVVLLRPPPDRYRHKLPVAEDVLLLIEAADTSLTYDRETKLPLYAQAGIPEVWIVDLSGKQAEVYRDPEEGCYRVATTHTRGSSLVPGAFPDIAITCEAIIG